MDPIRLPVVPYEGDQPYIFVSYCHRDVFRIMPLLRALSERGYRLWYDEGVNPGTEWPESIARHLKGCAVCLAFVSELSLLSTDCRREINYAISKNKAFLSVILEPVDMSPGMDLQISSYQSLMRFKYPDEETFLQKLLALDIFRECLEEKAPAPAPSAPEEPPMSELEELSSLLALSDLKRSLTREKKPGDKNPARSWRKASKRQKLALLLPLVAAAMLLVILLGFLASDGSVTIAGKKYRGQASFFLSDAELSAQDMSALERLWDCRTLYIRNCTFPDDAARHLAAIVNLTDLEISDCQGLDSLRFFQFMPELRSLTIRNCGITDAMWAELVLLPSKLTDLDLSGNELSTLTPPSGLIRLNLKNNRITEMDLGRQEALLELDLSGNGLERLAGLESCTGLRILDLSGNAIGDLSGMETLVYLEELDLSGNPFRSAAPLSNTSLLRRADLSFCPNAADLDFLERSAGTLTTLILSYVPLEDPGFLQACTRLSTLLVQGCGLTDLSFAEKMPRLQVLGASENQIVSLAPLAGCTELRCLDLSGNRIGSAEGLPPAPEPEEGKTGKALILLLGDNPLSELSGLDTGYSFRLLDLGGVRLTNGIGAGYSGDLLIADMSPAQDPARLSGFSRICVPKEDLSSQVAWESALPNRLTWLSREEALDQCAAELSELRPWQAGS